MALSKLFNAAHAEYSKIKGLIKLPEGIVCLDAQRQKEMVLAKPCTNYGCTVAMGYSVTVLKLKY